MAIPFFYIVKTNEFGLSGIGNPDPGVGRYGGVWGSMHRPIQSLRVTDCAIVSGEVKLPEGFTGDVYNAEFLQFDLSIVNQGEDWNLPNPDTNPELFTVWQCNNVHQKKQLKDFVLITLTDLSGNVVKEAKYPGIFFTDTFFPANDVYFVHNRFTIFGQRIQMNFVPDGTYKIEIKINPVFGPSEACITFVKFTGQDIEIVPEPVVIFPKNLVWEVFRGA